MDTEGLQVIGLPEDKRLTMPSYRLPGGGTRRTIIDGKKVAKSAMDFYWALKKYEDTGLTPEEAAALLKERTPRILTLDEAIALDATVPVWVEWRDANPKYGCRLSMVQEKGAERYFGLLYPEYYGTFQRIWVGSKPTDEQRAAAKWATELPPRWKYRAAE